jgi:hypothetical protein
MWIVLLLDFVVGNIVILNLLISIVGETYGVVREHKVEYQF